MKKIRVFIEIGKDGSYNAYMPDDDGLNYGVTGEGGTVEEAVSDFKAVYEAMKEGFAERGEPFEEVEFDFQYDVPSFLAFYKNRLSLAGLQRITGINQRQLSQYVNGYRHPSPKTTKKIEDSLHKFGKELTQVNFHFA